MDLTLWPDSIAQTTTPSIVTVGMFDGVHAGHRFLLSALAGEARSRGLRPVALTFDRHPLSIIDPLRAPAMLAPLPERLAMMEACGCAAGAIHFDEATRQLSAAQFMAALRSRLGAETLLMGFNHRLGHDRLSTPGQYRQAAAEAGIEVLFAPPLPRHYGGAPVSSSAIREALRQGAARQAAEMLGRHYALEGTVGHGQRIGRTLGFPTANIAVEPAEMLIPAHGVYAAIAVIPDGQRHFAVVNIGVRPTVDTTVSPAVSVEAYLLGYEGDLYGSRLKVEFVERLRPERRFDSVSCLRSQIAADAEGARAILSAEADKEMP